MRRAAAGRVGIACAAASALLLAVGGPGAAANASTRLADDASGCTVNSQDVLAANDQTAVPWEIQQADPGQLSSGADAATGAGVKVAVIDTGVAAGNSQVASAVVDGENLAGGAASDFLQDVDGHGTMVASIIAARRSGANGMVGIAPGAELLVYREAGCGITKGGDEKTLAQAVNLAVDAGARVINISQVGYDPDASLEAAVQNAYESGVVVVAATGNYGSSQPASGNYGVNPVTYPADYAPYVLAVGAVDQNGSVAPFSETGSYVGVVAPGVAVGALFPDDKIVMDDGTSFAAPYVAGEAALLIQRHPDWSAGTVMKVIEATASGGGTWNSSSGWGEVNPLNALQANESTLPKLYGAGPNADGPAPKAAAYHGASMAPIVAQPPNPLAMTQRRGAYTALAVAGLLIVIALFGAFITRDARRRRL